MKKNVVFIHLESLNQAVFSKRHWFPCINQVLRYSASLNNFISTATSSVMALSDLLHGDDNVMEHNTQLEVDVSVRRNAPALFDQLQQEGYTTAGMGYPKNRANIDHVWSDHQRFQWLDNATEMMARAEAVVTQPEPFALYFWNLCSHLCYGDNIKYSGKNSFERWHKGYQSMDVTVGMIFQLLLKHKKLDNTIVVAFGDHGDDFWNHGFNGGFAHGIEPYTSLVHTPAFIFNAGEKAREMNDLVSLIDLKDWVLQLSGVKENGKGSPEILTSSFPVRKYCYSRNLFANQKGLSNGSPLNKGYAITSEQFHLLKVNDEFRMFAWQADAGNQVDLLSLVKNNQMDLSAAARERKGGVHPHMAHFFSGDADAVIVEAFNTMKHHLNDWIDSKHQRLAAQ